MIKSITVTNYLGDSIKFDLARPELSGFAIMSVEGLGPGKSNINTTEVSTNDGGVFNSARLSSRNIVLSMVMWQDDIEAARHQTYKYFPIKKKVTLLFETDNRVAEIDGYVEANEPRIFSSIEYTDISIICPDPFFRAAGADGTNITLFHDVDPLFEFPFCNDSLTDSLIEMSSVKHTNEQVVIYKGDSEIGLTFVMYFLGEVTNITLYNLSTREVMKIDTDKLESLTGSPIKAGDEITICTVKGKKSVTLIRDGEAINILNCLSKNSQWFKLVKGDNIFAYASETGIDNMQLRLENGVIYEGV